MTATSLTTNLTLSAKRATALFSKAAGRRSMTIPQIAVLEAVDAGEEPSQTDLVERTGIDRSTLADIVRRLIKSGHLQRKRREDDGRAYIVTMTSKGEKTLAAGKIAMAATNDALLKEWPRLSVLADVPPDSWNCPQEVGTGKERRRG